MSSAPSTPTPSSWIHHLPFFYGWIILVIGSLGIFLSAPGQTFQDVYIALAQEILQVALAHHISPECFNGFDPAAFMPGTAVVHSLKSLEEMSQFNRQSAKTHSGVWRDLAVRRRRAEAKHQLGPIVSHGQQVGVPTPMTARLIELIHEIENGARPQEVANLDVLKALM